MIFIGVISILIFFSFVVKQEVIGNTYLYALLMITLLFMAIKSFHEWYHFLNITVKETPVTDKVFTVDILTTHCPGEPYEMIMETLKAIKKISYPHTSYLCDEGNDPFLIDLCKELDVIHVTRFTRENAKAGNINNALKQATGEICVILDPDHVPQADFLDSIIPHFSNKQIGFVQIVQSYKNNRENFVCKAAAEQSYLFYGPMMMTMNHYGTVQAIGANCTFRRKALDSIGGHAPGLAEDMHTAMQLHAKGWKSVYVPEVKAKGLVPSTLSAYYKQQLKWSRGVLELLVVTYPKLFKNFTLRQKIHYGLLPGYYLLSIASLINLLLPIISIFSNQIPLKLYLSECMVIGVPWFISQLMIRQYVQKWLINDNERGLHLLGGIVFLGSWWIHLMGIFFTLIRRKVPYEPTPKDDKNGNKISIIVPNLIMLMLSLFTLAYANYKVELIGYFFVMKLMLIINSLVCAFNSLLCFEPQLRKYYHKNISITKFNTSLKKVRIRIWILKHDVYIKMGNYSIFILIACLLMSIYLISTIESFKYTTIADSELITVITETDKDILTDIHSLNYNTKVRILKPSIVIYEGLNVGYRALLIENDQINIITTNRFPDYQLEWYLIKLDLNKDYYRTLFISNENLAEFIIPENYKQYRLLLKITKDSKTSYCLSRLNTPIN
jgi:cellulose synthase/poly-beta-1,6-N-acetylglucosamine synthase-like glycosyltransferase